MDKYEIIEKIGQGGFSDVYKARTTKEPRCYVALKMISKKALNTEGVDPLVEAQVHRELSDHPHVVKIIDSFYDRNLGSMCIVTELLDMDLRKYLSDDCRGEGMSEERCKEIMYKVFSAVSYLHKQGYIHRDIKPENIFYCSASGNVKLGDFSSCTKSRMTSQKTSNLDWASTRWYKAPECLLDSGNYSNKLDVWSLGCVLFEVITGFPLFPGNNDIDQLQLIEHICGDSLPQNELKSGVWSRLRENFKELTKRGRGKNRIGSNPFESVLASNENYPAFCRISSEAASILKDLLEYDPKKRISAKDAMAHPYFETLRAKKNGSKNLISPRKDKLPSMSSVYNGKTFKQSSQKEYTPMQALDSSQLVDP